MASHLYPDNKPMRKLLSTLLALTFATPDQPNGVIQKRLASLHAESEQYHPHARFRR